MAPAALSKRNIELLLAEDVPNLGSQGDIVGVKPGFARNFLLPQGLATVATDHNKKMVEQHRIRLDELEADRLKSIKELANNVNKYSVTLEANANHEGHLYGSITAPEISKALKTANYEVEPEHIKLDGPLKELGMYTVKLEFHEKIKTEVKVWVVPAVSK
ncbi:50S ribosomal protein L9 [Polystyrenella longa]|uniref:Large ribosomal subunit protein bL9 n=1 Tax=Polystyrenella longa TaxID=2528007 RepID=A0A518CKG2_9PLAN|nr:50S ribosomal protein L9 [Polystyrenella longa]QDU79711.1 50S ribosomal protein L9 [Polystyrenella longa]